MSDEAVDRLKKYLDAVDESHRTPFQKSVSYTDHDAGTFAWELFQVADLRALLAAHDALTEKCKAQMEALREWDERVGRLQDANDALTAEVTVSEAMVEAFTRAWDGQKTLEKPRSERIRVALTAALAERADIDRTLHGTPTSDRADAEA